MIKEATERVQEWKDSQSIYTFKIKLEKTLGYVSWSRSKGLNVSWFCQHYSMSVLDIVSILIC